ncbi:MAG: ABC transporter permease [Mahellales bacterium]|jgi:rhamnose transport system permease protein
MMKKGLKIRNKEFTFGLGRFREVGLLIFIIVISIIINLRNPNFLSFGNIHDMLLDTSILAILAVGMMLVIVTRGIDLSIGSGVALTGMIVGLTVSRYQQVPPAVAILMGIALGVGLGAITGLIVSKGKVLPIIATLGMMNVYRGITFIVSGGKWVNAHQMSENFKLMTRNTVFGLSNLIIFAAVVYIVSYYFINHTRTGRQIYAVGSNPAAAKISGIMVDKIIFLVYTLMGALYGMAGVLWVSRYSSAQNDTATGFEMMVISACVIGGVNMTGGTGNISGLLLGSLLVGIINNALPLIKVSPFWKQAIQGFVILFAVMVNALILRRVERNNLSKRKI